MPPASHASFAASLSREPPLGTGPDNNSGNSESEVQPKLSKKALKKARNASRQTWTLEETNKTSENEVIRVEPDPEPDPPPAPVAAPSLLSQITHGFPRPQKTSLLFNPEDQFRDSVGEKVSDQSTPPNDDFFRNLSHRHSPPREPTITATSLANSPPVQPGFSTRAAFNSRSPPISPPQRYSRPVSYGGGVPPLPAQPRMSTSPYSRTTSHYGSPPAPHLPQQHFYHAQDIEVPHRRPSNGHEAQEPTLVKHTLIPSIQGGSRSGMLVGYPGRLSLLQLHGDKVEEIGALTGLPGAVVDALLVAASPVERNADGTSSLVAITLHQSKEVDSPNEQADNAPGMLGYPAATLASTQYVTSVELYSLSSQRHLTTILEAPSVILQSYRGTLPDPVPPIGNLKLFASGKFFVVASGTSGEVFVFTVGADLEVDVLCVAKLWTHVQRQMQRRDSSHDRSSDTDISPADLSRGLVPEERAIVDLNGRWLAISPASLPSRPSLNARLGPEVKCLRYAGVEAITAPAKPSLTCEVDSPDADTMLGKVARGVAQELVKGAKWLGDQSYQTWQNYWKKDQSPALAGQSHQPYSPPTFPAHRQAAAFPPTHAEPVVVSKEPEIVSIYDLELLCGQSAKARSDQMKPLATFQPPRGCSYVSFAPGGLNLLTAGRKGDVQYVWDLKQIRFCRAYVAIEDSDHLRAQPQVRQIARYERLSGSTVVDITWESPTGARLAVLTLNRTVHVFDLPESSFQWPPPRSGRRARAARKSVDNNLGSDTNQGGFFASAMTIASKAQPIVAGWRGRAPSMSGGLAGIGQTSIGIATATGARSGKAVAAGLSKSLGAASETVSHMRHAGESRLHINSHHQLTSGMVTWVAQGQIAELCVLNQDSVKNYRVRKSKPQDRGSRESTSVFDSRKATVVRLPQLRELRSFSEDGGSEAAEQESPYGGFYHVNENLQPSIRTHQHPLSYAEIETNAPYQPFHSDRRVSLCVFADHTPEPVSVTAMDHSKWIFGDEIPVYSINLSRIQATDDEETQGSVIYRETTLTTDIGQDGREHIVSTTRRARKKKGHSGPEHEDEMTKDDFFEDDCEVLDFATDRV